MAKTVFDVLKGRIERIYRLHRVSYAGSPKDYANYRGVVGLIRVLEATNLMLKTSRVTIWKKIMTNTVTKLADEQWEDPTSVPVGYRLLVALPDIDDHYESTSLSRLILKNIVNTLCLLWA